MSIKVHIHKTHRIFTDGFSIVEVDGNTTGECLCELIKRFPEMKKVLFTSQGELLNTIEICVNNEGTYPEQLAKPLANGDDIQLILFLSGG